MFDALGAAFGATMAGCLFLVGATGAAVYMFTQWRKSVAERKSFEEMRSVIYSEIRDICEVGLVKETFTSKVEIDTDKKIPFVDVHLPGSSRKFSMDYAGTIVCGFDCKSVEISRDGAWSNKIKILLPPSEILHIYPDVDSYRINRQDAGIFAANIKLEEQNALVADDVKKRRQRAIREGILIRADENARKLLMTRILNRGLNRSFDVEILTLGTGNVRQLNPPR